MKTPNQYNTKFFTSIDYGIAVIVMSLCFEFEFLKTMMLCWIVICSQSHITISLNRGYANLSSTDKRRLIINTCFLTIIYIYLLSWHYVVAFFLILSFINIIWGMKNISVEKKDMYEYVLNNMIDSLLLIYWLFSLTTVICYWFSILFNPNMYIIIIIRIIIPIVLSFLLFYLLDYTNK